MSAREKKLLIFFAAVGFFIINVLAYNYFNAKRLELSRRLDQAQSKLEAAQKYSEDREAVTEQMDWLTQHEPEPAANQDVKTKLQQLCENEAKTTSLLIKSQKPLPTDETAGLYFHRAKIQLTVSGNEEALYRWFDRLNIPEQLRIATNIRISPNSQDDTLIDCTATIEQWFVPLPPSS